MQTDELSYLCKICQHIDFKYFINSFILQRLEEIKLNSLTHILENEKCAFCYLMTFIIKNIIVKHEIDITVAEKFVM